MKHPGAILAAYLSRRVIRGASARLPEGPLPRLVVVIPAMAEWPGLLDTLADLDRGAHGDLARQVLVLVVVNQPANAPDPVRENNRLTLEALADPRNIGLVRLRVGVIDAASVPVIPEGEGVGTARKLGMDAAAALLESGGNPWGGIVCLDADTRVDQDYLARWYTCFAEGHRWGLVCEAWHRPDVSMPSDDAMVAYECRLRCHELGLWLAGSPYGYPVIGSAMACSAVAYAAAGGMNRRSAGEDFYFLQALAKTGRIEKVPGIRVYPAGRVSDRVPFGTGRTMKHARDDPGQRPRAYHPGIYRLIRHVVDTVPYLETGDPRGFMETLNRESAHLAAFFDSASFPQAWERIAVNHHHATARRRAFHEWFDGFRTLKLVHFLRDAGWGTMTPEAAAIDLLEQAVRTQPAYGSVIQEQDGSSETVSVLERLRRACQAWCRGPWGLEAL
ncbi:MAG TPA: hypothetical protein PK379_00575 [Candidatus Hydrogenedentes bacterium]|nr:hypothetical protein [Candidatus Hydrogenedentota bacterium]HOK88497.1 hypothetical protein [Candidatus Hydrogenedentota bacterium]